MSHARLRTVRTVVLLAAAACFATACQPEAGGSGTGAPVPAASGPAGSSPADAAAAKKTSCEAILVAYKKEAVGIAEDAIAQLDKPLSEQDAQKQLRKRYTGLAEGMRGQAGSAPAGPVRAAVEDLAATIEKRLADPKPVTADEPEIQKKTEAVDAACK